MKKLLLWEETVGQIFQKLEIIAKKVFCSAVERLQTAKIRHSWNFHSFPLSGKHFDEASYLKRNKVIPSD